MTAIATRLKLLDPGGVVTTLGAGVVAALVFGAAVALAIPFISRDSEAVTLAHQVRDAEARAVEARGVVHDALAKLDDGKCVVLAWDTIRPQGLREVSFVSAEASRLLGVSRSTPYPWKQLDQRLRDLALGKEVDAPSAIDRIRRSVAGAGDPAWLIHTADGVRFANTNWYDLQGHTVCVVHLREAEPFFHQLRRPSIDAPDSSVQHSGR